MPLALSNFFYDSSEFPAAQVPALPVLEIGAFSLSIHPESSGILANDNVLHFYSGRYALAMALKLAGIKAGDRVLLPAYHCLAMVEPLLLAGARPIYYSLNQNLSANLAHIEKCVASVKAIIAVHYFGFPKDLRPIRNLADHFGVVLIEDCAHACFGCINENALGSLGDYAIASPMKFFPIGHGGVLASARHRLVETAVKDPPLKVELKTAFNLLEQAHTYSRIGRLGGMLNILIQTKNRLIRIKQRSQFLAPHSIDSPAIAAPEYAMDSRWLGWRSSRVSRFLLRHARIDVLIERRRHHYKALLNAIAGRRDCHPLFPELTDGVVPQVFPLYVNRCLPVFVSLKRQGVPIIRFGEFLDAAVDSDLCPVSVDYSEHVLQFPCHQTLRDEEITWIIERLIIALDAASKG